MQSRRRDLFCMNSAEGIFGGGRIPKFPITKSSRAVQGMRSERFVFKCGSSLSPSKIQARHAPFRNMEKTPRHDDQTLTATQRDCKYSPG
jgi:hypothetical protein